jgi:hypothetical protein
MAAAKKKAEQYAKKLETAPGEVQAAMFGGAVTAPADLQKQYKTVLAELKKWANYKVSYAKNNLPRLFKHKVDVNTARRGKAQSGALAALFGGGVKADFAVLFPGVSTPGYRQGSVLYIPTDFTVEAWQNADFTGKNWVWKGPDGYVNFHDASLRIHDSGNPQAWVIRPNWLTPAFVRGLAMKVAEFFSPAYGCKLTAANYKSDPLYTTLLKATQNLGSYFNPKTRASMVGTMEATLRHAIAVFKSRCEAQQAPKTCPRVPGVYLAKNDKIAAAFKKAGWVPFSADMPHCFMKPKACKPGEVKIRVPENFPVAAWIDELRSRGYTGIYESAPGFVCAKKAVTAQPAPPALPAPVPAACPPGTIKAPDSTRARVYRNAGWKENPPGSGCFVFKAPSGKCPPGSFAVKSAEQWERRWYDQGRYQARNTPGCFSASTHAARQRPAAPPAPPVPAPVPAKVQQVQQPLQQVKQQPVQQVKQQQAQPVKQQVVQPVQKKIGTAISSFDNTTAKGFGWMYNPHTLSGQLTTGRFGWMYNPYTLGGFSPDGIYTIGGHYSPDGYYSAGPMTTGLSNPWGPTPTLTFGPGGFGRTISGHYSPDGYYSAGPMTAGGSWGPTPTLIFGPGGFGTIAGHYSPDGYYITGPMTAGIR